MPAVLPREELAQHFFPRGLSHDTVSHQVCPGITYVPELVYLVV